MVLIAPTVGIILQDPARGLSKEDEMFFTGLLGTISTQTAIVASQLGIESRAGRVVFIGSKSHEPRWISQAKAEQWEAFSVSPDASTRDSDFTYDVKGIDPKTIVASNAEILVSFHTNRLTKTLIEIQLPEALVVTKGVTTHRYYFLENAEPQELDMPDFSRAIQNLICGSHVQNNKPTIEPVKASHHGFSFGGIFPTMVRILSRKSHRVTWQFKHFSELQVSALAFRDSKLFRPSTCKVLNEARNSIVPSFVRADESAVYYGDRYRSLILLGLLATLIAFLALILAHINVTWGFTLRIIEIVALSAVLFTAGAERWFRMHRKWLMHRMVAELLRPTQYLLPLWLRTSRAFNFPERSKYLSSAIAYHRLIVREKSPLSLHMDQNYLDEMRHVLIDLLSSQIEWHRLNADTYQRCQKWLVRTNVVFFLILLLLLLLPGIQSLFSETLSHWGEWPFVLASICTLCISISGAGIHYFSFDHIAERSEVALRRYQTLSDHIKSFAVNVTYINIKLWMQSATDVMADEQLDWFRQTSRLHVLL